MYRFSIWNKFNKFKILRSLETHRNQSSDFLHKSIYYGLHFLVSLNTEKETRKRKTKNYSNFSVVTPKTDFTVNVL